MTRKGNYLRRASTLIVAMFLFGATNAGASVQRAGSGGNRSSDATRVEARKSAASKASSATRSQAQSVKERPARRATFSKGTDSRAPASPARDRVAGSTGRSASPSVARPERMDTGSASNSSRTTGGTRSAATAGSVSAGRSATGTRSSVAAQRAANARSSGNTQVGGGSRSPNGTRGTSTTRSATAARGAIGTDSGIRNSGRARSSTATRIDSRSRSVNGSRSTLNGRYRAPLRSYGIPVLRSPAIRYFPRIRIYTRPVLQIRWPRIHVHISWPWVIRARRHWAPSYRYRQVVYVQANAGVRARSTRVELETQYRHRVLSATDDRAELEITVDAIDVYYEGRHLGSVDYIPRNLATIYATVFSDGQVRFDREIFMLGDPFTGFELISTRYYGGYVLDEYRSGDGYFAGRVNLRDRSVREIARSRLFDPFSASGYIPISLLPESEGWLWDYGADAISAAADNYDYYYGQERAGLSGSSAYFSDPLRASDEYRFRTNAGTDVFMTRETELQRIE